MRKPTVVECLRGKKIVHVAVGALHCLAVADTGQVRRSSKEPILVEVHLYVITNHQVFAWGDNDHGQQGNATTAVNRKPALVHGIEVAK